MSWINLFCKKIPNVGYVRKNEVNSITMKRDMNINTEVIRNIVTTVIQQYIENLDNGNQILDEVPVPIDKGLEWGYYCVIYQTLSINGKHQYHIERNVVATSPKDASDKILTRWEVEESGNNKGLTIKIICVKEDDGYDEE